MTDDCKHDKIAFSTVALVCPQCEPDRYVALLAANPFIGTQGHVAYYLNLALGDLRIAFDKAEAEGSVGIADTIRYLKAMILDLMRRDYPEFWGTYDRDGKTD